MFLFSASACSARQWLRCACLILICGVLSACGGGGVETSAVTEVPTASALSIASPLASMPAVSVAAPALALQSPSVPRASITPAELALIVAEGDSLSEAVALRYQRARSIPDANLIRVAMPRGRDEITELEFNAIKARVDARLPAQVQATLLTFTQPSRVAGPCTMGITSAFAMGYDAAQCGGCTRTRASAYFDSESTRPFADLGVRPSMMLGTTTLEEADALINRGLAAEASFPAGTGWVVRTPDPLRSVRYTDWQALPARWGAEGGMDLRYLDATGSWSAALLQGLDGVLFYFTGHTAADGIRSLRWRPGAVADHLTSLGGVLEGGSGHMPINEWLRAGATASYGTVEEPCNYTQKFPQVSVLLDHYLRGATVIEAYWKSVAWPGQGLFVGDPLARPWTDMPVSRIEAGQWLLQTRNLRRGARYQAHWRADAAAEWQTVASMTAGLPGAAPWRVSLPSSQGQLRWLGPCAGNAAQSCVLGE